MAGCYSLAPNPNCRTVLVNIKQSILSAIFGQLFYDPGMLLALSLNLKF